MSTSGDMVMVSIDELVDHFFDTTLKPMLTVKTELSEPERVQALCKLAFASGMLTAFRNTIEDPSLTPEECAPDVEDYLKKARYNPNRPKTNDPIN